MWAVLTARVKPGDNCKCYVCVWAVLTARVTPGDNCKCYVCMWAVLTAELSRALIRDNVWSANL
jgi:hypothetical protein